MTRTARCTATRGRSLRGGLVAWLAVHQLVVWAYVWFATGGTFSFAPGADQYEHLAEAFVAGQVHLKIEPSPELLALPDPYHPRQNFPYRLHDAALYKGQYYSVFGPVPAVVHAGWLGLTGHHASTALLQMLVALGSCAWFWLLLRALRTRAFPDVPEWLVLATYLCYALGGVGLYLVVRPITYHELYVWMSFFVLGGLYWWLRALDEPRHAIWQLALAGLLFGGAFGSRLNGLAYAVGPGLVLLWRWLRAPRSRPAAAGLAAYGLGLAAVCAPMLAYNHARFGSIAELGGSYVLAGFRQDSPAALFSLDHVLPTLGVYLFTVPTLIPFYPFQYTSPGIEWRPPRYLEGPFTSVALLAPLIFLAPLAVRSLAARTSGPPAGVRALVLAAGLGVLGAVAGILTWHAASGRHMHDFVPVATLLGGLGLWSIWRAGREHRATRLAQGALAGILVLVSVGMGTTYAMNAQDAGYLEAYSADRTLAFDTALGTALRRVAPGLWPAAYLARDVAGRPRGIFYPAEGHLTVPAPSGQWATGVTLKSIFPDPTRVLVEVDGGIRAQGVLSRGRHYLPFDVVVPVSPTAELAVRLHFPERTGPDGALWPVRVGALSTSPSSALVAPAAPRADDTVVGPFVVGGWAIDRGAGPGPGIDAVQIYAHPVVGGAPLFLGAAEYGGPRPDVAALYGPRFANSGFSLVVSGLAPGRYAIESRARSTRTGAFASSRVMNVNVR